MSTASPNKLASFPFTLAHLTSFIIRRKNGDVVRYTLGTPSYVAKGSTATTSVPRSYQSHSSVSQWCNHNPASLPVFAAKGVALYIADASGCRAHSSKFDLTLDCGAIFAAATADNGIVAGDPTVAKVIAPHVVDLPQRIVRIRWADRQDPAIRPTMWPALTNYLITAAEQQSEPFTVLTACQGGHGRSGTALTAIMMCLSDYTPLDAITHLRAIHCPRAIESVIQHEYLNKLAAELKREQNAQEAEKVTDFRSRFLALTNPIALPYQNRLKSANNLTDTVSKHEPAYYGGM